MLVLNELISNTRCSSIYSFNFVIAANDFSLNNALFESLQSKDACWIFYIVEPKKKIELNLNWKKLRLISGRLRLSFQCQITYFRCQQNSLHAFGC